jgi:hypothetical protein
MYYRGGTLLNLLAENNGNGSKGLAAGIVNSANFVITLPDLLIVLGR